MDAEAQDDRGRLERSGVDLQEVSNAIVRIYKEMFGRGPTKARTAYAGPDTLISTLEDSMTPAEHNMVALGEHQRLRDIRMFFQHASEREFIEVVEGITGRTVRAFVSGMDVDHDVASEIFYFEPTARAASPTAVETALPG